MTFSSDGINGVFPLSAHSSLDDDGPAALYLPELLGNVRGKRRSAPDNGQGQDSGGYLHFRLSVDVVAGVGVDVVVVVVLVVVVVVGGGGGGRVGVVAGASA